MPRGQNDGFFKFACKTAAHFKDEARVAKELYEVAGSDKKLNAKVKPALTSLRKYGMYSQALASVRLATEYLDPDSCCCLHLNNTTAFRARVC